MRGRFAAIRSTDAVEFPGREITTVTSPNLLQVRSVRSPQLLPMRPIRYESA